MKHFKKIHLNKVLASTALLSSTFFGLALTPFSYAENAHQLNLKTISKMNATCLAEAKKENYDVAIAIFNQDGTLLSFTQTDGAAPATGEVARWKGLSAAHYRASTAETAKWNVPTAPNIATIQGGVAIFSKQGAALGSIAVSGAPPAFDERCGISATKAVGLVNNPKK